MNTYIGYPVYKAENFSMFDDDHLIYGLSLGTPLGIKTGLSYSTLNFELINYIFGNTNPLENDFLSKFFGKRDHFSFVNFVFRVIIIKENSQRFEKKIINCCHRSHMLCIPL